MYGYGANIYQLFEPAVNAQNTVTNYTQFRGKNPKASAGTITNARGMSLEEITRGTNNTNFLLGTDTSVTGSLNIYSVSTRPSFFAGAFLNTVASTPSAPSNNAGGFYIKGDKFIIYYNDAGTVRYKYMTLSGTGVTWTHTTTAP